MKIILETWNSVNFKYLVKQEIKNVSIRKFSPLAAFQELKGFSGLCYGRDDKGLYFGSPNTGYDLPAYRVRGIGE